MKRILVLLAVMLVMLVAVPKTQAQDRVDLGVIRHITQPFIQGLSQGNLAIRTTYQPGTFYRKDWSQGTFMSLTGKAFVWTDATGVAHLDMFTKSPPMSLEGFRPPMTLYTSPNDADGNIVLGDGEEYWKRYRIWQTRSVVRFDIKLMYENQGVANAWNYWVSGRSDMHKYVEQWRELGFNDDGTVPGGYYPQAFVSQYFPEYEVDWANVSAMQPLEDVLDYQVPEGNLDWVHDDAPVGRWILEGLAFVGLIIIAYGTIKVGRRERELA